ncbi:MAG: B12-binding domain-containing radical SAM protein [Deltaproteobacteria bacterium]|nr:B12-binding domain-containing radical SAM protein [Deltaproteobacteria bacterium]
MILISPSGDRPKKLGVFAKYVPLSVPYGIGALAGYLHHKGKKAEVLDEEIEPANPEVLLSKTKDLTPPYIFGISSLTAGIARSIEIARTIKNIPDFSDAKVIFGGIHPTVLPEDVLQSGYADIVVRGEGEQAVEILYDRIKGGKDYSDVEGISFFSNENIIHNDRAKLVDLNSLPSFPYDLFYRYSPRYALGFITSSRGCPYDCVFCSQRSISGKFYRFRSPETVLEEIEYLFKNRGQSHLIFQDDNFLPVKDRAMKLCELIIDRFGDKISFDCQARADNVDDEVLAMMKESGCRLIHVGIECASDRLLSLVQKRETLQQIIDGVRLIQKHGIQVSGTFILGFPTETSEDRKAAYELAKKLDLAFVRFNNATPYPGTKLYEMARTQGQFLPGDNWENLNACGSLTENPFRRNKLSFVPDGVSEGELRNDIIKYNLFFSLRPKRVFRLVFNRFGPAGWFELPEKWFLKPGEWYSLIRFSVKIGVNFLVMMAGILKYKLRSLASG